MKIERYQMYYLRQMKYYTLIFHELLGVESHRKYECVKKKNSLSKYQLELRTIPTFMIYLKFSRDKRLNKNKVLANIKNSGQIIRRNAHTTLQNEIIKKSSSVFRTSLKQETH